MEKSYKSLKIHLKPRVYTEDTSSPFYILKGTWMKWLKKY